MVVDPDVNPVIAGPLGCGFQTGAGAVLNLLNPRAGSALVVFGGGAVGLAGMLAALSADVGTVVVVEPSPQRRALAESLGATAAFVPGVDPDELRRSPEYGELRAEVGRAVKAAAA